MMFFIVNFIITMKECSKNYDYSNYDLSCTNIIYTLNSGEEVEITFASSTVKVNDCYKLQKKERIETLKFIMYYMKENEITTRRTINNLEGELLAHRMSYFLNIKKANAIDADLDYIKDSRWYVNAVTMLFEISGF